MLKHLLTWGCCCNISIKNKVLEVFCAGWAQWRRFWRAQKREGEFTPLIYRPSSEVYIPLVGGAEWGGVIKCYQIGVG